MTAQQLTSGIFFDTPESLLRQIGDEQPSLGRRPNPGRPIQRESERRGAHQPLLTPEPGDRSRSGVDPGRAVAFRAEPHAAVVLQPHSVHRHAADAIVLLPAPPAVDLPPGEQTGFGPGQHFAVAERQNLINQLAFQTRGGREAFPLAVASPPRQASSRKPQPNRILSVAQDGVHGALQALSLAHGSEAWTIADGQAFDRRHEQTAEGVHRQLASTSRLGKAWVRGIEALASASHDRERPEVVHPQIAASVAADAHPISGRQAVRLAEHGRFLTGRPTQPCAAAEPHVVSLEEHAVGVWTAGACGLGQQPVRPHGSRLVRWPDNETAVGRDEGLAPTVKLNGAVAVDACALERHGYEAIAILLVEPAPIPGQHVSIWSLAKTQSDLARKPLGRSVTLKPLTVVTEHAVFGPSPHKAGPILKEHLDGGVRQAVLHAVVAKTVLLCGRRRGQRQAGQEGDSKAARDPGCLYSVRQERRRDAALGGPTVLRQDMRLGTFVVHVKFVGKSSVPKPRH